MKLLVLIALSIGVAAGCKDDQLQCSDGQSCFSEGEWCDGVENCEDGSDEQLCNALVPLPVNSSVTATVQFGTENFGIVLLLCGAHCGVVVLVGERDDGTLRYGTLTGCGITLSNCSQYSDHTDGLGYDFPGGEVVLEVQHRPGELAVWRRGRPDDVATVPVEADYGTLRVQPARWNVDMPVQFSDVSCSVPGQVKCLSGDCVEATAFCDGTENCSDGSDEDPATCASSTTVAPTQPPVPITTSPAAASSTPTSTPADTTTSRPSSTSSTPSPPSPVPITTSPAAASSTPTSAPEDTSTSRPTPTPSTPSPPAPWPPAPAPTQCAPEWAFLLLPAPDRCDQYVVCYSGFSRIMPCPAGLRFNYRLQTCDWPANVVCG